MKVIPLEHLEEEFANLLEEKQLELIRYPAKREKYAISFRTDVEDGIHSFFFYRYDPMSTFYESAFDWCGEYLEDVCGESCDVFTKNSSRYAEHIFVLLS